MLWQRVKIIENMQINNDNTTDSKEQIKIDRMKENKKKKMENDEFCKDYANIFFSYFFKSFIFNEIDLYTFMIIFGNLSYIMCFKYVEENIKKIKIDCNNIKIQDDHINSDLKKIIQKFKNMKKIENINDEEIKVILKGGLSYNQNCNFENNSDIDFDIWIGEKISYNYLINNIDNMNGWLNYVDYLLSVLPDENIDVNNNTYWKNTFNIVFIILWHLIDEILYMMFNINKKEIEPIFRKNELVQDTCNV